jgi:hypothetical protein
METLVRNVVWDLDTIRARLLTAPMMPTRARNPLIYSSLLFAVFTEQATSSSGLEIVAAMRHRRGYSAAIRFCAVIDNRAGRR